LGHTAKCPISRFTSIRLHTAKCPVLRRVPAKPSALEQQKPLTTREKPLRRASKPCDPFLCNRANRSVPGPPLKGPLHMIETLLEFCCYSSPQRLAFLFRNKSKLQKTYRDVKKRCCSPMPLGVGPLGRIWIRSPRIAVLAIPTETYPYTEPARVKLH